MKRAYNIQRATSELFDVVVIGGGITGAGIALTAAKKGWKTLIIDKHDFSFGTSSRSAKMIHGGLRYLQHLQIKLVKEALHDGGPNTTTFDIDKQHAATILFHNAYHP